MTPFREVIPSSVPGTSSKHALGMSTGALIQKVADFGSVTSQGRFTSNVDASTTSNTLSGPGSSASPSETRSTSQRPRRDEQEVTMESDSGLRWNGIGGRGGDLSVRLPPAYTQN